MWDAEFSDETARPRVAPKEERRHSRPRVGLARRGDGVEVRPVIASAPMSSLTELSTPRRLDDDRFLWDVPAGWRQGRGAFGGLVVAALVRAVEMAAETKERHVRSVAAHLVGPVLDGPAEIAVSRLRIGNGLSSLSSMLRQGDEVLAQATVILGKERSTDFDCEDRSPLPSPPWEDVPPLPIAPPLGPEFAQHFEFRTAGPFPFTATAEARSAGWIRSKNPGQGRDAAHVAALADCYWPAILARASEPRPTATVAYNLQIVADCGELDPSLPLFHRGNALAGLGGYIAEHRELRTPDGKLVALNQQTFAVVR